MPEWVQVVVELNPMKHFVAVMRAILVRGAGFADLQSPFWILVTWSIAILVLAVRQYSKRTA